MKLHPDYFRNLIFGAEDALVSTSGVLFGVASAGNYTPKQIILTGFVVVAVEALSMGAGAFLTEEQVHEINKNHKDKTVIDGLIMFFSYLLTGLAVMVPYLLLSVETAKVASIFLTLAMLFVLGIFPKRNIKDGLRMTLVAGGAILIGFLVATFVDTL